MDVDETAHQLEELKVEVEEELEPALIERTEVIGIVEEEGGAGVGRHEGVPMKMTPVAVFADAHVAHEGFLLCAFLGRDGERLDARGAHDAAAVAVGLLQVMVVLLNAHFLPLACCQLGNIPDRRKRGGREQHISCTSTQG